MGGVWMCVATVVAVVALHGDCEGGSIRPSLDGLLNAEEISKQIDLIEALVAKFIKGSKCADLKQKVTEEEPMKAENGSIIEMKPKAAMDDEDECNYAKIQATHTMLLPPNEDCKVRKTGVTEEEKELILTLHNNRRAMVASGNETQGDPGPQPTAANMRQLVWNEELAKVAQAWAAQCPSGHDKERNRRICSRMYRVGQNINYFWGVLDDGPDWEKAVENWYSEVKDVAADIAASFKPHKTKKIGHYTQVVWGDTREIGCGIVYYETEKQGITYPYSITYVCNYGPSGNVRKYPIYKSGPPASKCPTNVSSTYPDLCL